MSTGINLAQIEEVKQVVRDNPNKIDMSNPYKPERIEDGKIIGNPCCVAAILSALRPDLASFNRGSDQVIAEAFGCTLKTGTTLAYGDFSHRMPHLSKITAEEVIEALDEIACTGYLRTYEEKTAEVQA